MPHQIPGPLACGMFTGAGSVSETLRLRPGDSIALRALTVDPRR
ncbi:hypothetical protein ACFY1L_53425 [Streptomyces sp. NPDC001663]